MEGRRERERERGLALFLASVGYLTFSERLGGSRTFEAVVIFSNMINPMSLVLVCVPCLDYAFLLRSRLVAG